jgi:hypothetical protein
MTEQLDDEEEPSTIEAVASPGATAIGILLFVLVTSAVVLLVSVVLGLALVAVIHGREVDAVFRVSHSASNHCGDSHFRAFHCNLNADLKLARNPRFVRRTY